MTISNRIQEFQTGKLIFQRNLNEVLDTRTQFHDR